MTIRYKKSLTSLSRDAERQLSRSCFIRAHKECSGYRRHPNGDGNRMIVERCECLCHDTNVSYRTKLVPRFYRLVK